MMSWKDFTYNLAVKYYMKQIKGRLAEIVKDSFHDPRLETNIIYTPSNYYNFKGMIVEVSRGKTRLNPLINGEFDYAWEKSSLENTITVRARILDKLTEVYLHHVAFILVIDESLRIRWIQESHNSEWVPGCVDPFEGNENEDELEQLEELYSIENAVTGFEHNFCEDRFRRFVEEYT